MNKYTDQELVTYWIQSYDKKYLYELYDRHQSKTFEICATLFPVENDRKQEAFRMWN